jgi:hypothetical protein
MFRIINHGRTSMRPFVILPSALLTLAFAIAIGAPITADAKTKTVSQSKVLAACKRTAGCKLQSLGGGDYIGSTPNVNFICYHGRCWATIVKGGAPGSGGRIGGVTIPPGTVQSISGGSDKTTRHPVNVGAPSKPTKVKTPIATGKGGGMNQGGRRH